MDCSGHMLLKIVHIIHYIGQRIIDVDRQYFPVRLSRIEQRQHTQHLDWSHTACLQLACTKFNHIQRIIISRTTSILRSMIGILPGLRQRAIVKHHIAVLIEPKFAILDILMNGIKCFTSGDFVFCPRPFRYFTDEIEDVLPFEVMQWDIVPWRDLLQFAIVLFVMKGEAKLSGISLSHRLNHNLGDIECCLLEASTDKLELLRIRLISLSADMLAVPPTDKRIERDFVCFLWIQFLHDIHCFFISQRLT
mmetsp:Transcript_35491/g.56905  ORF Transcript_35491/g.56905 Transcript_35491/m.56905 type:complete len:250 (-) Transcript_35491:424-1173(-)